MTAEKFSIMFGVVTPQHAQAYFDLRQIIFSENPQSFECTAEEEYARGLTGLRTVIASTTILGAFHKDRLIGTVSFSRVSGQRAIHRGQIYDFFVEGPYRGSGVADTLMKDVTRLARRCDVTQLELLVSQAAPQAQSFYRKHGFLEAGCLPQAIVVDERRIDFLMMIKDLTNNKDETGNKPKMDQSNPRAA